MRGHDLVDEADREGPRRVDEFGGEEKVFRGRGADQLHEPAGGGGRVDDAELRGRDADARAGGGEAQVTGDGELTSAADAVSVEQGERGLGERGQLLLRDRRESAVAGAAEVTQVADVGPGAERVAGPTQHHHPNGGVDGQPVQHEAQVVPHGGGHDVPLGDVVDRHCGDRAAHVQVETVGTLSWLTHAFHPTSAARLMPSRPRRVRNFHTNLLQVARCPTMCMREGGVA
jgi:hypothetical protein